MYVIQYAAVVSELVRLLRHKSIYSQINYTIKKLKKVHGLEPSTSVDVISSDNIIMHACVFSASPEAWSIHVVHE